MTADNRPVAYCTTRNSIIDLLRNGETADAAFRRLVEYGSTLIVLPLDEAWQRHETAFNAEPVEITESQWHDMLGVLPPVAWQRDANGESFKLSERTTGAITAIYVHLNKRYFTFSDDIRTPHAECCKRVAVSPAFNGPPLGAECPADVGETIDPRTVIQWNDDRDDR